VDQQGHMCLLHSHIHAFTESLHTCTYCRKVMLRDCVFDTYLQHMYRNVPIDLSHEQVYPDQHAKEAYDDVKDLDNTERNRSVRGSTNGRDDM
jgi:hypothetical protein